MDDQDRWHALRAMGVPGAVVSYVQSQNPSAGFYLVHMALTFALLIAGGLVGVFLWAPLQALTVGNAVEHTVGVGGLMYHVNFGFAGVIALFGWIVVAAAIANLLILGERNRAGYFAFSIATAQRHWTSFLVAGSLNKVADLSGDPKAYIKAWIDRGTRSLGITAILAVLVSVYALSRDLHAHTVYTAADYIRSPFFPWGSSEPRPWRTATRVELGCNHVTGRNAEDYLVYRVYFPDGGDVSLQSATPLPHVDWLVVAEQIDARAREGGATFERWSPRDRDPLHPSCLAVMQRNFGSDYPRIERLLRIGELPAR